MERDNRSTYGSFGGMPEFLLQPGDCWSYPKWLVDFYMGRGEGKIHNSALRFLEFLSDNQWHLKTYPELGVGTIEACVDLGLVQQKHHEDFPDGGFSVQHKITPVGKEVLETRVLSLEKSYISSEMQKYDGPAD